MRIQTQLTANCKNSMNTLLSTLTIAAVAFTSTVSAFSTGTGSCEAGVASIENSNPANTHVQYAGYPGSTSTRQGARGTIAEAATIVSVNGQNLSPGVPVSFPAGTDLVWQVSAAAVAYKGIFVRVEKTSDDFTHTPVGATLQNVALCDTIPGVVGVAQVSSAPQSAAQGTMNFASAGSVTMDVILVFDNIISSLYAFDSFQLNIEDGAPTVPVEPPVAAPTATVSPVAATDSPAGIPETESPAGIPTPVTEPPVAEPPVAEPPVAEPTVTDPPSSDPPTTDECTGKGKGGMMMGKGSGEGSGKGKGSDSSGKGKGGMMMGMKCKEPKEPKTPKAGKGMGKGKGSGSDDDSVSR